MSTTGNSTLALSSKDFSNSKVSVEPRMRRQHLAAVVNPLNGLPWSESEPRSGASMAHCLRVDTRS